MLHEIDGPNWNNITDIQTGTFSFSLSSFSFLPPPFFSTLSFLLSYITTVHYNTKSHLRKTVLKISGSPFRYEVGKIIVWSGEKKKKKKESIIRRAEWNIWYTGLSTWLQPKNSIWKRLWILDFGLLFFLNLDFIWK